MKRSLFFYSVIMIAIVLLDRITKMWALAACAAKPLVVNSFLSFSLAYNRGMAWSLAASNDSYVFMAVTALVVLITIVMTYHAYRWHQEHKSVLGQIFIIAGALGNLYDRFAFGGVIDFIECSYAGWYWPIFNGADIAVVVGVGIVLYVHNKEVL